MGLCFTLSQIPEFFKEMTSDFDILQINVFLYLAENDVHYCLCNYFACDPRNYPSSNIVIATIAQEPFVVGVRPHLQQISILPFHE